MDKEYYNSETITVVVTYDIWWAKENPESRKDAIDLALRLPVDGGGASIHGCYRAVRGEVSIDVALEG